MRRFSTMLFIMILALAGASLACQTILPASTPTVTAIPPSATTSPTAPPTTTPLPSATPPPTVSPSPPLSLSPTLQATALSSPLSLSPTLIPLAETPTAPPAGSAFTVKYHPDGSLYVGDLVSLEVIAPPGLSLPDASLTVEVAGQSLGPFSFGQWGIAGRYQATPLWAWDTQSLPAGNYTLTFTIQPQALSWSESVTLLPASDLPPGQGSAQWAVLETTCCTIHYVTNTAAERDLAALAVVIDQQAVTSVEQMHTDFSEKIVITLLPRLLGHGGFASSEISVSYLDRNYAANAWDMVIHHEMIHILDARLGGDLRPTFFVEGLAVYMAGGHFKPEPLMPRAAALLLDDLRWYLPLAPLADDFYSAQHEISYLEAAALIEYMVERWGWEEFSAFYRDIHPAANNLQSEAIDAALQAHFGLTFAQLEQDYIAALRLEPEAAAWREDIRLTVLFFDTLRRYQEMLDPSAYFRTAWLLNTPDMRSRGIVADYLRHPSAPANLALETMLNAAGADVMEGSFLSAEQTLAAVNAVLDGFAERSPDPFAIHPLAADHLAITLALLDAGYEPQRITLSGDAATILATAGNTELVVLELQRAANWSVP